MADNIIEPDVDEQNTESIDLANNSEFPELLTPLKQMRKRKGRSITNTPPQVQINHPNLRSRNSHTTILKLLIKCQHLGQSLTAVHLAPLKESPVKN